MRALKIVCVASALLAAAVTSAAAQAIKIGAIVSTTGPAAYLGEPEMKTFELEIERLNENGGLLGRKVEMIAYDDGSEAAKANGLIKRLIDNDGVDVVIGGTTTGATMAMIPQAEKSQIPFISLAGGIPIVEPVKKWVFKTPHTDRMAVARVFDDMIKHKIDRVALLTDSSGFGQSGRKEALALAPRVGLHIVADEVYGPKDADVTAQLTKIRGTDAQTLFVFGFGQGAAVVTKNVTQLGFKLPHYESHGVAAKDYIELTGAAAEGVRLPAAALIVAEQLRDDDPQKPVAMDYITRYRARYHDDPSTFGGHVYDAIRIWAAAVQRAGSADKAKVRDEIEKTTNYIGTAGVVNMTPEDHMGLNTNAFRMITVESGAWKLID